MTIAQDEFRLLEWCGHPTISARHRRLGAWHACRADIKAAAGVYNQLFAMDLTDNQGIRIRFARLHAATQGASAGDRIARGLVDLVAAG